MDKANDKAADDPRAIILSPKDNVCVACVDLEAGTRLVIDGVPLQVRERVALGHKLARYEIAAGEDVIKYGAPIGSATRKITRGEHIHTQNLKSNYLPTYTLDGSSPYLEPAP